MIADETTCRRAMQPGDCSTLFLLVANVVCANLYLATIPNCTRDIEDSPHSPETRCVRS